MFAFQQVGHNAIGQSSMTINCMMEFVTHTNARSETQYEFLAPLVSNTRIIFDIEQ